MSSAGILFRICCDDQHCSRGGRYADENVSVYESEDALKESLTKQYTGSDAFEVQSFEAAAAGTLKTYEYVVKYNSTSMWSYSITYAILADHEAYVIQGTVTDDNKVLLEAVKKSVESFKVPGNSVFNLEKAGTVQNQSETNESETEGDADAELKTLQDYSTAATLYANDDVNVRQDPSKENDDNIIGSLEKGQAVTVVGETSGWFKVNIDGNIGYVSKEFLVSLPVSETDSSETGSSETNAQTDQSGETGGDSSMIDAEKNSQVDYTGSSTLYTTTDVNVRQEPGTGQRYRGRTGKRRSSDGGWRDRQLVCGFCKRNDRLYFQVLSEFFSDTDGRKRR